MVVLMTVAACYGIIQLAALYLCSRTVRASTLFLAVATGVYGCGVLALALQLAYTRLIHEVTGRPLSEVVETASYTVDPVLEELVKILPLVVVVVLVRRFRRQWGYADHLLVGAAVGAGFSLAEALLRYSGRASWAMSDGDGGFLLPTGLYPPQVTGVGATLARWLPAPIQTMDLFGGPSDGFNDHLAWTALAGLGLGLVIRGRDRRRFLGLLPILYACVDHAAMNYGVVHSGASDVVGLLVEAAGAARQGLPGLILLALIGAIVLDLRAIRRIRDRHPELLLASERAGGLRLLALIRLALVAPPWTPVVVLRFVMARRAAWYELADASAGQRTKLTSAVALVAAQLDGAYDRGRWRRAWATVGGGGRLSLRALRNWRSVVWLVLLAPAVFYLVIGAAPATGVIQTVMASTVVLGAVAALSALGVAYLVWQLVGLIRQLPAALRQPWGQAAVRAGLRILTGVGAVLAGVALLGRWLTGAEGDDHVMASYHILDALSSILMVAALVLFLAALFMFPPFALVGVAGGGAILVMTEVAATTGAMVAGSVVLGGTGMLLSKASGPPGSGGSSELKPNGRRKGVNLDPDTRGAVKQKLPDEWGEGRATDKGVGTRWQDPDYGGNGVRVDKGNPDSSLPSQRVDHVIVRHKGNVIGPDGEPVAGSVKKEWQAHIPLVDWLKWGTWWHP